MIHQRSRTLIEKIKSFGCYFLVLIHMWFRAANIEPSEEIINSVYKKALKARAINENCYLFYGAALVISTILNGMFNQNIFITYVGRFKNGVYTYDNMINKKFTNLVGRHDKGDPNNSHFKEISKTGECILDTWPELGFTKDDLRGSRLFYVEKS